MVEQRVQPASGVSLCTRCGLCCSGVIFDYVPVEQDERAGLTDLGFEILEDGEEAKFPQPCRMFSGSLCSIYAERPAACRKFQCKVLRRYHDGSIAEEEAFFLIEAAKSLVEKLKPQLEEGESVASARKRWRLERQRVVEGGASAMSPDQARFHLNMASLNIFLDKHFRAAGREVMTEQPLGGSGDPG